MLENTHLAIAPLEGSLCVWAFGITTPGSYQIAVLNGLLAYILIGVGITSIGVLSFAHGYMAAEIWVYG